ncbi:hypothetical protein HPY86_07295 [candidate division WOR-3 bacterium]|nr:hypothetical protein [candidate division WOR-3 bacterium]
MRAEGKAIPFINIFATPIGSLIQTKSGLEQDGPYLTAVKVFTLSDLTTLPGTDREIEFRTEPKSGAKIIRLVGNKSAD